MGIVYWEDLATWKWEFLGMKVFAFDFLGDQNDIFVGIMFQYLREFCLLAGKNVSISVICC